MSDTDERMDGLLRFAGNALTDARLDEYCDWDGGEIQDALESCGLIECVTRVVPCCEDCRCLEYADRGERTQCYPLTALGQEAVRTFRAWQDAQTAESPAHHEDVRR